MVRKIPVCQTVQQLYISHFPNSMYRLQLLSKQFNWQQVCHGKVLITLAFPMSYLVIHSIECPFSSKFSVGTYEESGTNINCNMHGLVTCPKHAYDLNHNSLDCKQPYITRAQMLKMNVTQGTECISAITIAGIYVNDTFTTKLHGHGIGCNVCCHKKCMEILFPVFYHPPHPMLP